MVCGALINAMEVRNVSDILTYNIRYLFQDYFNFLANVMFGKKYYVKVNGVWSSWRGRRKRNGNLIVRYGVDKHKWELSENDFARCKESNKEKIQQKTIDLNVRDLQSLAPENTAFRDRMIRFRTRPTREDRMQALLTNDFDREFRRVIANMNDIMENT